MTTFKEKIGEVTCHAYPKILKYYAIDQSASFFQPLKTLSDVQEQMKGMVIPAIISLTSFITNLSFLIQDLLVLGGGLLCLSPSLALQGGENGLAHIAAGIITPIRACVTAITMLIKLLTRTLATVFCCGDRNDFEQKSHCENEINSCVL